MTEIFAHRGASGYAPENTLEAFRLAMEQGADGIELDVHLTKDGEVVVIHDETLNRTSNGQGKVRDYTLEELKKFSFHNHMEKYKGVQIPTLKEVLDLVENSSMKVNIELKTGIYWYEGIEAKTMEIVKSRKMADFLETYLNSGLKVRVWTVNNKEDMKMFMDVGVDAVITNYPDLALK